MGKLISYLKIKEEYIRKFEFYNENKKKFVEIYMKYIKPFVFEQVLCIVFLLIFSLTNLMYPYFLKLIIDDALGNNSVYKLFQYSIAMLVIVLLMLVSRYFLANKTLILCQKVILKIKQSIIEKLFQYSQVFFRQYQNGEIISIIENDLQQVQKIAMYMISELLVAIITTIGLMVIIFTINYHVAIVCVVLVVVYAYLQKNFGEKIKSTAFDLSKSKGKLYSYTQEIIYNITDIKMLNCQIKYKKRYKTKCKKYFEKEENVVNWGVCSNIIGIIFKNLALVLVLCLGGYMMLKGDMTIGVLFSLSIYVQQLFSPIITLTNLFIEFKKMQALIKRVSSLINNDRYLIQNGYLIPDISIDNNTIVLKDLIFKYGDDILFNNVNLKINTGEKIALIGKNGSGKTTFIRLLMRLQKDYDGEIFLGKYNIKKIKLDFIRQNIICISQNPFIFNGTILDNIRMYNNEISEGIVNEIINLVCLKEDIDNMSNGLNTTIGDKGIALSGGQAQKIALARLFLIRHPIVVLDEPTSALDIKSENIICKNIYKYLSEKTIIVITHRESILKYCSKIYQLKNTKIIEANI